MRALYTAATGMAAQQTRLDNIANNLANSSTTGFKKSREAFQDSLYQELTQGGKGVSVARAEVGAGVQLAAIEKDHANGSITETGDAMNVAIQGNGLFVVETPEGDQLFTRDGNLSLDPDGTLMTASGLRLAGDIVVPQDATSFTIRDDGTVAATLYGDTNETVLGQLEIASFVNPAGLRSLGGNVYAQTPESGEALIPELGREVTIQHGALESSNVDVAEELIQMIMAQRAYELNSKVVQASDETLQVAANLRR